MYLTVGLSLILVLTILLINAFFFAPPLLITINKIMSASFIAKLLDTLLTLNQP